MSARLTFDDGREPSPVELDQDLVLFGSGAKADLVIEDPNLSPLHCALAHTPGGWKILDLYSRQGTRVNGESVADHYLQPGDRIRLGKLCAIFEITEDDPPEEGGDIKLESGRGEWWSLESDSALIGSWGGCDIVVDGAEPAHVIVVNSHRGAVVRAIGEAGIVIVNGRRTDGCSLQDGDVLQVGEECFTVRAPHLPRRSDGEPMEDARAHSEVPTLGAIIEEQERILQLLDPVAQVPDEIGQLREEIGQQLRSLTEGMKSNADAVEVRERQVSDREAEHTSQIQALGSTLTEHGALVKELMDRLACVADATESSRNATESAVGKLHEERKWLSTELDSRDKALQKVWQGLVQVRKALASPPPEDAAVEATDKLREQVETLNKQFADLPSQLSQRLTDALKGLAKADQPGLAELAGQRAELEEREQRLAEERETLEEMRREVISRGEETVGEMAAAEQKQEQYRAELDQKESLLAQKEDQLEHSRQETERAHRQREQSLQAERQKLRTLKIEVEVREANSRDQASKLIRLCQKVARLGGSPDGAVASSSLLAFARGIAGKIEQPGRIIASASKNVAAEGLLHRPPSGDGSESLGPSPVGSSPNSSLNS
ncbi:MAG: FHA domain-containing protein [Phycisphaerae bacterium]